LLEGENMETTKYNVNQQAISTILGYVSGGNIAIPEIQRPFVWKKTQVRDLIDSLYNGYPAGYIIMWQNPNIKLKDGSNSMGKKILIDGQQRVTALMTSLLGMKVIDSNYKEQVIKIAFNPLAQDGEERFAVQDSSHLKSKKWIPDISEIFIKGFSTYKFIGEYCKNNPEANDDNINSVLMKLISILNCQIGVVELSHSLDINEVTEIFIRINSQGKTLNQGDFAMSKIAADEKYGGNMLRKTIDYFSHLAVAPHFFSHIRDNDAGFSSSEYFHKISWLKEDNEDIYDPEFSDILRVALMSQFYRGKLSDLVSLLAGRNFETMSFEERIVEESFAKLREGVLAFINEYNFKQFVLSLKSLGLIKGKMLTSQVTLDFAYTLYLMLSKENEVSKSEVKYYVQKWFVLSVLTSRYITSPESVMDKDIRFIREKGFKQFFEEQEAAELSDTFWNVGLVQKLETSSINSPYFNVYCAAQVKFSNTSLFSTTTKVSDLISVAGDIHHIFPKEYLKQNGMDDKTRYNQVANYIYLDTQVNISIGKKSPKEYFNIVLKQCENITILIGTLQSRDDFDRNLSENDIPESIVDMEATDYGDFLLERRRLMAEKIRKYYYSI